MFRFSRRQVIKGLVAILCVLAISWLALDYFIPAPPSKITIATASKGSTFYYSASNIGRDWPAPE
jgi:hypothetical protein